MSRLPTGIVTFLFTDIEGSTKLAQEHPDKWESLRERHHAILQTAMDTHSGYVFQIIGDAFCVAFHTSNDALLAAIKSQIDLYNQDWDDAPVKVRMGIHTGEAELQTKKDYRGYLAMSRVQRLMSAGHGGQTLISQKAKENIQAELPEGLIMRDMGERRLKDMIQPEHIFQIVIPNLPADFPPLKTLDVYRHNLPAQITSFIGRKKEMTEIKQSIATHRLITLTGSGGTGKTRLSMQIAADMLDQFPDGVRFIELAPLTEAELIPQAILSTFGIGDRGDSTSLQRLTDSLREKKLLLVLDNCEHLIEACAKLANTLLNNTQTLKIMATSREALGVKGEAIWHLPSLSLPDLKHLPAIDQLSKYEAVQLFIERATLVQPHFLMTNENAPAIAQICFRLDGIPLAIELAAARVRALSVDQISARLDDRFHLLTGGSRIALERQQTLRAAIDWSYNLLSADEKLLLCRLAVFAGGWMLEAAEQVCIQEDAAPAGGGGLDIVDLLTHLVDKSLVIMSESAGEVRYRMLETTRQYAREKLTESGESNILRDRHLDYFLKLKEAAEPKMRSAEQLIWLNLLEAEHDNLRTALEWSLGKEDPEVGLRFTGTGWFLWGMRGYSKEGARFLKAALEKPGTGKRTAVRAKALTGLAYMARYQGDLPASTKAALEGVEIWREVGDKWWLAFTLGRLGGNLLIQGDLIGAREIQEEAVQLAREAEDKWALGDVLGNLCRVFKNSGDYQTARSVQEEGLAVYRSVGDKSCIAEALEGLGTLTHIQGDYEQAAVLYKEGLQICRELHYVGAMLPLLIELGCVLQGQGDNEKAETLFIETLVLAQEAGVREESAYALAGLGGVAAAQGRPEQAALLLGASESIFNALGVGIFSSYPQCFVDYNRWVANVHSQLDEEAFNNAWAEGRAMSTDEGIEYALEETYE